MPQPCFERLSERLLRAGIAPRRVHRYVGELRDHFDDLVREATASGMTRPAAEAKALSRLGRENDLADTMLARPGLRSIAARFPWAVFGLGSAALVIAALVIGLGVETAALNLVSAQTSGWTPSQGFLRWFTLGVEAWNTLAVHVAPIGAAALLCVIGTRQRVSDGWIFLGIAIACFLGGFQHLSWYDTGSRGVMTFSSGLMPPFPNFAIGAAHAAANFALVTAAWRLVTHRRVFS
jgi:hypothetical protein